MLNSAALRTPTEASDSATGCPGILQQLDAAIELLVAGLEDRRDRGALVLQDPVLRLAREHIDQAVAGGAGPAHRARLDRLLASLAPVVPSLTPHLNGIVLAGEPAIRRPTADDAAKTAARRAAVARDVAKRGPSARSGRESRRFKRFLSPALSVRVENSGYRTLDWSIGGLSLAGGQLDLPAGREVRIVITVTGIEDAEKPSFHDRAVVVRSDAAAGRLVLRFVSSASAALKILEYLRRKRLEPAEAPPAAA